MQFSDVGIIDMIGRSINEPIYGQVIHKIIFSLWILYTVLQENS